LANGLLDSSLFADESFPLRLAENPRMPNAVELVRAVQQLSFCYDAESLRTVLKESARLLTGADGVSIIRRDGDLCHYVDESAISPLWKGHRFPMSACISGWCMLNRQPVAIADIYADSRIPHEAYRPTFVKSLALVPIRSEAPVGALGAYWSQTREVDASELEVLQALADAASMALQTIEYLDTLKLQSRRKDEFLSMLAHELRNPLAPLRNGLHIIQLAAGRDSQVMKAHAMMDRQIVHLTRIIDDLLDVARISTGRVSLRSERLDLARLISQCVEDHRSEFESAGVRITVDTPSSLVWVFGDQTRLVQILDNLIGNARKFTAQLGEVNVRLTIENDPDFAVVSVRDTGVGIESALLPHLFEPFMQADQSLDRMSGGLGIGLSVARGLVELHHGSIRAQSEGIGKGSEFIFRIPREVDLPALAAPAAISTGGPNSLRVLVVEDNRDSAECLRMLLTLCGYEVTVAHSGTDALECIKLSRPQVVLCDIGLPGIDGYGVARALRQNPETAAVRLLAITGYGHEDDFRRTSDAGFDAHLVKPVKPEELLTHLRTVG
jgi:signal transduction histidine kinase/CheY-like chemotaxis protein